jgi:hypothetical protein
MVESGAGLNALAPVLSFSKIVMQEDQTFARVFARPPVVIVLMRADGFG